MTRKNLERVRRPFSAVFRLGSEKGTALVLTLLILVLITALITEFSYAVFTTTSALYNWRDSQRLSFVAKSGTSLAVKIISSAPQNELYKYLGKDIPVDNMLEGFEGSVVVRAEDEGGKFNLNSLITDQNSDTQVTVNNSQQSVMSIFKRLLNNLGLNEDIAGRVADWIDRDGNPRLRDSEDGAKNGFMDSTDELLLIKGVDRVTYEKLLPYVTVYGPHNVVNININTAPIPVIMSLNSAISREMAESVIRYRAVEPFNNTGELQQRVPGFDPTLVSAISGMVVWGKPLNLRITVIAEENKIKRVIESVVSGQQIQYWKEL
ncbi:MAG TPA: type II secretion system minor pseudopilin GspK [Thermodesulfovibrionales bacterium]|nr:type II secretion system minor pseudopilin GspK [Thermodesulfovibrionales bacterium]